MRRSGGRGDGRRLRYGLWLPRLTAVVALGLVGAPLAHLAPARAGTRNMDGVVNLNTAPMELLSLLPGIGPSKARGIVAYRTRRPFRTVDELVRVKGIGRRMVREIRTHLAVAGPSTARGQGGKGAGASPAPPPLPAAVIRPLPRVLTPASHNRLRRQKDPPFPRSPANHCAPPA